MKEIMKLTDFRVEQDENGIAWVYFDKANSSTNTLGTAVLNELEAIIEHFEQEPPAGLVITTAKKSGFIAGADIKEISNMKEEQQVRDYLAKGQGLFSRIEKLKCRTVALIRGFCLGGGTELSLACDYRIAEDRKDMRMGLPEVMLGIQPGWGGTVRLPRLIGATKALELMVSGRALRGKQAQRIGLVDYLLPERELFRAASQVILKKDKKRYPAVYNRLFNYKLFRMPIAKLVRKSIAKRALREHYPAPYSIVDNWEACGTHNEQGYKLEVESIIKLAAGNTSRNLFRVFFLQESLKGQGKVSRFKAKCVHVIGAGTMGADIAAHCAMQGLQVTLQDRSAEYIAKAFKRIAGSYKKILKDPRLVNKYMDYLTPDIKGEGVSKADVIIEAVFEDLKAKQDIFKDLEQRAPKHAILATNTSSIPLDEINTAMQQPQRLVGIHFFNPVAKMQLVEVVHGAKTDESIKNDAQAFVAQIKKLPLAVKSSPGFLVNRVLMPYLMEAMQLLQEGVSPTAIDKAAVKFGMPMGPVELADVVGLDICLSVAEHLIDTFDVTIPDDLKNRVKAGNLGKKSGKGFYNWENGKPSKSSVGAQNKSMPQAQIQNRLILRFVNEAMACLREGIVATADEVDTGVIFGTGFAPFRGGPLNYAKTQGVPHIQSELEQYSKQYGDRFAPDQGWQDATY
jgi:3-hydroxyacyl-CoA dehydrogenase/enoyl-CoA hydratase/3-hydroxybutyryl-CoA epimerase